MPTSPSRVRRLAPLAAFALALFVVPHRVAAYDARLYSPARADAGEELADSVADWTSRELDAARFHTGSAHYDSEWFFATYMMGAMGFGQRALAHPEESARDLARMERCLDVLLTSRDAKAFDTRKWGEDPIAARGDRGHVAYLGYLGLALGLHRALVPTSRFASVHDAIAAGLARRFERSPHGFVESFPGATFPVDNLAGVGALALHARATGTPHTRALDRALAGTRRFGVDPKTGLLVQVLDAQTGAARDAPRGSGTALGAYFLSFADPALARALAEAARRELYGTFLGFGALDEYPSGRRGHGDIDSGPMLLGLSVAATGFMIGPARALGDEDMFRRLYATAHLFGSPARRGGGRSFVTGGAVGDAILFAMLTAPSPELLDKNAPPRAHVAAAHAGGAR